VARRLDLMKTISALWNRYHVRPSVFLSVCLSVRLSVWKRKRNVEAEKSTPLQTLGGERRWEGGKGKVFNALTYNHPPTHTHTH
jgi:hypothetical protein